MSLEAEGVSREFSMSVQMRRVLHRQGLHLLAYLCLALPLLLSERAFPDGERRVWGLASSEWVWLSWLLAGVFQFWVALFWRLELHGGQVSARLGRAGFRWYRAGYVALGLLRLLSILPIAWTSRGTLRLPAWISFPFLAATIPLCLWGLYCAAVYFGVTRAAGADHFDPAYRKGFERRGIYRYVPNVMYTVVLLGLYHPGLVWHSGPALVAGAVHHTFVWVHYYCTERPDLEAMYGSAPGAEPLAIGRDRDC